MKHLLRQSASVHNYNDGTTTVITPPELDSLNDTKVDCPSKENISTGAINVSISSANSHMQKQRTACSKNVVIMLRKSGSRRSDTSISSATSAQKVVLLSSPSSTTAETGRSSTFGNQLTFWTSLILRNSSNLNVISKTQDTTFSPSATTPTLLSQKLVAFPSTPETTSSCTPLSIHNTQHPKERRSVTFNEAHNIIINSEFSSLKEYRKDMWWSHKDRIRSMKQREHDIQQILKLNKITNDIQHHDQKLLQTNSEAVPIENYSASGYCEAVITLYTYCYHQCVDGVKTKSRNKEPISGIVQDAIQLLVQSKYRGLERIVCKILQIQQQRSKKIYQRHHRKLQHELRTIVQNEQHSNAMSAQNDESKLNVSINISDIVVPESATDNVGCLCSKTIESNVATLVTDMTVEVSLVPSTEPLTPVHGHDPDSGDSSKQESILRSTKRHNLASMEGTSSSCAMIVRKHFLEYQNQLRQKLRQVAEVDRVVSNDASQQSRTSLVVDTFVQHDTFDDIQSLLSTYYVSNFHHIRQISIMWSELIATSTNASENI